MLHTATKNLHDSNRERSISTATVTIIIPVYNVQDYLSQCLQSVMHQTYTNLEILIINDGSTDRSAEICDYYSAIDQRIKVFHQTNAGLGSARNKGLSVANGQYISFVDSDDFIAENTIERALLSAQSSNADIVVFGQNWLYGKTTISQTKNMPFGVLSSEEAINNTYRPVGFVTACGKLFSKKILDGIRFRNGLHEDQDFAISVYTRSTRIFSLPEPLYFYRINRNGSIMTSTNNMDAKNIGLLEAALNNMATLLNFGYTKQIESEFNLLFEPTLFNVHLFKANSEKVLTIISRFKHWFIQNASRIKTGISIYTYWKMMDIAKANAKGVNNGFRYSRFVLFRIGLRDILAKSKRRLMSFRHEKHKNRGR